MWMQYVDKGSVLPPPFNLIPNYKLFAEFFRRCYDCIKPQKVRSKIGFVKMFACGNYHSKVIWHLLWFCFTTHRDFFFYKNNQLDEEDPKLIMACLQVFSRAWCLLCVFCFEFWLVHCAIYASRLLAVVLRILIGPLRSRNCAILRSL